MIITILSILLESIDSLFKGIKALLETKELTMGAILAGLAPFIWTLNRIRKEKEKRDRAKRVELRQLRIESKIDDLMRDRGVISTWSFQETGSNQEVRRRLKRLRSLLQVVTILRRKRFMDKLKSRKFWLTILAALIPVINTEFGIHLDFNNVALMVAAVLGGIGFIAHVDAKKVVAGIKDSPLLTMNYKEASTVLQLIHDDINKICADFKKNDGSQAFKDAMQAYAQIKPILDAIKHPEPLAVIVEDKVAV